MAASSGNIVVPGDILSKADEKHKGGKGTYVQRNCIISSVVGIVSVTESNDQSFLIEVKTQTEQNVVPSAGVIVTAKVTSVNPRFCKCAIICIEDTVLKEPFRGIIRKDDVRATDKDKVEMYKCFRPGDVVLARVMSLGDAHSYLLTTAENELGVVIAHSEAGVAMIPISWTEMQCPKTFVREKRKIAKVTPDNFTS